MKKIFLLGILIFGSLFMSGCSSNITSAEKMDDVVVSLLRNKEYSHKGLDKNEIILIDNFIKKEAYQNKILNLSSLSENSDVDLEIHSDSQGVYKQNGIFYMKYSDINFETVNDSETSQPYTYLATNIYFNGRVLNITKEIIPILYDDTKENPKYSYTYRGTVKYKDAIVSYYNSVSDDTGMRIVFSLNKNKISNIDMFYDISNSLYNVVSDTKDSSGIRSIMYVISKSVHANH